MMKGFWFCQCKSLRIGFCIFFICSHHSVSTAITLAWKIFWGTYFSTPVFKLHISPKSLGYMKWRIFGNHDLDLVCAHYLVVTAPRSPRQTKLEKIYLRMCTNTHFRKHNYAFLFISVLSNRTFCDYLEYTNVTR